MVVQKQQPLIGGDASFVGATTPEPRAEC